MTKEAKKIILGLMCVPIIAGFAQNRQEKILKTSAEASVKADVNNDGKVSVEDFIEIKRYLSSKAASDDNMAKNADVDGNGKVDIVDMIYVKNTILFGETEPKTTTVTEEPKQTTVVTTKEPAQSTAVITKETVATTNESVQTTVTTKPAQTTVSTTKKTEQTTVTSKAPLVTTVTTTVATTPVATTTVTKATTASKFPAEIPDPANDSDKKLIADQINQKRTENGMKELIIDTKLSYVADKRAEELPILFETTRPNGKSASSILSEYDMLDMGFCQYILMDYNADAVVKNLVGTDYLDTFYDNIGVGKFISGKTKYWVVFLTR